MTAYEYLDDVVVADVTRDSIVWATVTCDLNYYVGCSLDFVVTISL